MDCEKVGRLLRALREEKGYTQKQLADRLFISDKAVSKWERGLGCPDVSLLSKLSELLGTRAEQLLSGDLSPNQPDGGNMKKTKFYICPVCGNVLTAAGEAEITCCGRRLEPIDAKPCDPAHQPNIESAEDEFYITFPHEMTKTHYLMFVAYMTFDRMMLVRLYPEQNAEVRMPRMHGGQFYFACNRDGLWTYKEPRPTANSAHTRG